jgi:hypothetical protein
MRAAAAKIIAEIIAQIMMVMVMVIAQIMMVNLVLEYAGPSRPRPLAATKCNRNNKQLVAMHPSSYSSY